MNCQKCRAPLRLDRSLQDLNPAAFDMLAGSTSHTKDEGHRTSRSAYPPNRKTLYNTTIQNATSPIYKRVVPGPVPGATIHSSAATALGSHDNPNMSFVMLTESQVNSVPQAGEDTSWRKDVSSRADSEAHPVDQKTSGDEGSWSQQVESVKHLFEILSARSDVDHPICNECTEILLSSLQARLTESTKERDAYISFLKTLNNNPPAPLEVEKARSALASANTEEANAFEELLKLEADKAKLQDDIAHLEAESLALIKDEQEFWRSQNAFALELSRFQDDRDALAAAYDHDSQQLERLQRTNVYNDTFSIGHDGFFGTINGLRLGRLPPPQNVDWSEINAAWGTAALLLVTVAEKLGYVFRGYRIKPMGSTSIIERLDYPSPQQSGTRSTRSSLPASGSQTKPKVTKLELFSSGDLPLVGMILHRRLDAGMIAFLECLRQLGEFVEQGSHDNADTNARSNGTPPHEPLPRDISVVHGGLQLPYKIHKDKIQDTSIKLSVSADEAWTRACKYVLTCCKYLLAHASNSSAAGSSNG